jgi:hypothetical protein
MLGWCKCEGAADVLQVIAHRLVIGFVVEFGRANGEFGAEDFGAVLGDLKSDVTGAISGIQASPKGGAVLDVGWLCGRLPWMER